MASASRQVCDWDWISAVVVLTGSSDAHGQASEHETRTVERAHLRAVDGPRHTGPVSDMRPLAGGSSEATSSRIWPRPTLVVPRTEVGAPRFAAIDIHNHLGRWLSEDGSFLGGSLADLQATMADLHLEAIVNLDGLWGEELEANLERYDRAAPGRVFTFAHLDWGLLGLGDVASPEVTRALIDSVVDSHRRGAKGLKVWKDLGLTRRDATGALVMPDDPRVVAALRVAGDLGLPVLIHTADPVAFFQPLDATNERIDELAEMPSWWFGGPGFPTFAQLIDSLHALVAACPQTRFIGAHVGGHAEDLDAVGAALMRLPNFVVDTGGRMAELGRQPRHFRRFVERFPDRVLFGTDCFPLHPPAVHTWWRFLETEDEHFDYGDDGEPPGQGNWRVSGVGLPDSLLRAVYRDNAARILGI